jgi:hypothetical protein
MSINNGKKLRKNGLRPKLKQHNLMEYGHAWNTGPNTLSSRAIYLNTVRLFCHKLCKNSPPFPLFISENIRKLQHHFWYNQKPAVFICRLLLTHASGHTVPLLLQHPLYLCHKTTVLVPAALITCHSLLNNETVGTIFWEPFYQYVFYI